MNGAYVLAVGAVSALGSGEKAFSVGDFGARARVGIDDDPELGRAGLLRPVAARVRCATVAADRATDLLRSALVQCIDQLEPSWLKKRIGLAVGTSSGGMLSAERFLLAVNRGEKVAPELARAATYFGPLEEATAALGLSFSPRVSVLGACASSTIAIGLALRWLALDRCDVVLAGGYDALGTFVASGFEALRATTATRPRPFRTGRDGMALGEGAGIVALARAKGRAELGYVAGFGASTDALHLTAPDAKGEGLGRAASLAMVDAGVSAAEIDLVSAHATATPFNDASEARAIALALGDPARCLVHTFKAQVGHTLGAAGVLESLAALDAVQKGIGPASPGEGEIDPDCSVRMNPTNEKLASRAALKLSSAFGGANAALVLAARPRGECRSTPARGVFLRAKATVSAALDRTSMAEVLAGRHPHLHRMDELSRLVVSAVHRLSLVEGVPILRGAGLVVGHALATLEHNELFDARRRERGARAVEPRLFPATSPNAAPGECAIAFGLTGPTFAVGASLHGGLEALAVARDFVAAGDARSMLVVAVDLTGPVASALLAAAGAPTLPTGACACFLSTVSGPRAVPLDGAIPARLGDGSDATWAPPFGHRELASYLDRLARNLGD